LNEQEYAALLQYRATPERLSAKMLHNRRRRTLIWGYDTERHSFHVYIGNDDKLHIVSYTSEGYLLSHKTEDAASPQEYVPNKRVYPAACDVQFCRLLVGADVRIPYTTFEARPEQDFHGKQLEELIVIPADFEAPRVQMTFAQLELPEDLPMLRSPYIQERFEKAVFADIADFVAHAYQRVKFKNEDPEVFREGVARRLSFSVRRFGIDEGFYDEDDSIRDDITEKAKTTLVPPVMALLHSAHAVS
jgi:hypothetical protein